MFVSHQITDAQLKHTRNTVLEHRVTVYLEWSASTLAATPKIKPHV